jgi:uncharacterized alkaline shock family protein YloU
MEEQNMTEIQIDCEGAGKVMIADEVISTIAGTAALEIDGVSALAGSRDLAQILGRRSQTKGVVVEVDANSVTVTLNIVVKFGHQIQAVSEAIQKRVKSAIENMTGLNTLEVNINVVGILYDSSSKAKGASSKR